MKLNSIPEAVDALRDGEFVLVVDTAIGDTGAQGQPRDHAGLHREARAQTEEFVTTGVIAREAGAQTVEILLAAAVLGRKEDQIVAVGQDVEAKTRA